MNKENVKKWVDALRSGKYTQIRRRLYDGTGYCCLGVACLLAGLTPVKDKEGEYRLGGKKTLLPEEAMQWLGTSYDDVLFGIGPDRSSAVNLNDGLGYSFDQIADALEAAFLKEENVPA